MDFILKGYGYREFTYDPITQSQSYCDIQNTKMPMEIRDIFIYNRAGHRLYSENYFRQFSTIFRLIPYYAVGKPGGFLVSPSKVLIFLDGSWHGT